MAKFAIRVTPSARSDGIEGWRQDELRLRVRAAPEGGRANAAALRLLERALGAEVRLLAGARSRRKLVEVAGMSDQEVWAVLGRAL